MEAEREICGIPSRHIEEQEMVYSVIDGIDDMAMDALINTMKNVTER